MHVASAFTWEAGKGFRSSLVTSTGGAPGFTLADARQTGVGFTNVLRGDAYATNAVAHNGAGVAIGDVDGDGWQDLYFCSLQGANRLYRNVGNWRFQEVDIGPAACAEQFSAGAAFADVDGDGDLDLLVNGIAAGTRLFLNDGKGRLSENAMSGLSQTASATSLTLGDIDGDGDLDLYCPHYIDHMHLFDPTTRFSIMRREGRFVVLKVNDQPTTLPRLKDRFEVLSDGSVRELPEVHGLYRNDGNGSFAAVQFEPGRWSDEDGQPIPPFRDWGLSAMFRDLNGDGAPDLYVCNDNVSPDRIWINSGSGTFRLIDRYSFRHTSRSSMALDFADIDRDGYEDLLVLDMVSREHRRRMRQLVKDFPSTAERERMDSRPQFNRNTLFLRRPDGTYAEVALLAGLAATDWSWCPMFIDVDLDGYEDLLVSNGFESDVMDQDRNDLLRNPRGRFTRGQLSRPLELYPQWRTSNAVYRNRRDGTFEPISREWGFDSVGTSQGSALGDLDNDGDLDLVVNNLNHAAALYRNNGTNARIAVRLKGLRNTQGIGARVSLVGSTLTQSQEMICGGRYMSGDQALRVFAAVAGPMRLEVKWRSGTVTTIPNIQANRLYELDEAGAHRVTGAAPKAAPHPWFKDVSSLVPHTHVEDEYDDWAEQPCLPRRLSRLGPGLGWFDVNGDGWEDLLMPAAKGGELKVYLSSEGQSFRSVQAQAPAGEDQTAVLGWSSGSSNRTLLVGVSSGGARTQIASEVLVCSGDKLGTIQKLDMGSASVGPLAMADVDGNGELDVFAGGRYAFGRYPEAVSSKLWLNQQGRFEISSSAASTFQSIGMVSGAVFADLDGDGWPDLVLATEWGPVRVFKNKQGQFAEVTGQCGLAGFTGWWTSVAAGDFDGDGQLDIAAGNWGRNTMYELSQPRLFGVFYGDWNADGRIDLLEAWRREGEWFPVHNRAWLATTVPQLAASFATHEAFGEASIPTILGERLATSKLLEANELRSGVFLNRRNRFEWIPLPREAQFAPVFGISVADANADGNEDLFLAQNCFSSVPENVAREAISRDDSGRGLWLIGKGDGSFVPVDGSITGVKAYGELRGSAVADFNHDGRVDLAVAQNNAAPKLYVNQMEKRGLHVVLRTLPGNPIGAAIRLRYPSGRMGPARSVSVGAGYWSQNATAEVLGFPEPPVALWIRWPGGHEQTVSLQSGVLNVTVTRQ